jgi:hypothetical protein
MGGIIGLVCLVIILRWLWVMGWGVFAGMCDLLFGVFGLGWISGILLLVN